MVSSEDLYFRVQVYLPNKIALVLGDINVLDFIHKIQTYVNQIWSRRKFLISAHRTDLWTKIALELGYINASDFIHKTM